MTHSTIPATEAEKRHPKIWVTLKIILPFIAVLAGVIIMTTLMKTAPTATRKPPARTARLVEVVAIARTNARAVIPAMGLVQPSREITLHPQVSGAILEISEELIPGGTRRAGDWLVKIDPADYEIALRRAEAELAAAQGNLTLEQGQQVVARKEFELLGSDVISPEERALILREPQLAAAQARLDSARAALDLARLHLERTTVTAPFNAVVRERHVNTGTQVSPSTPIATITGADTYWIIAPVPVSQLRWIEIPDGAPSTGSPVRVTAGEGAPREGRVLRRLTNLEEGGRMAQVLIEVNDPLGGDSSPLLIGDFVRVEIEGVEITDVVALDRRFLRGHHEVWIMTSDDTLDIRPVDIAFRGERDVLVRSGLNENERIVITDLAAPVNGMKLATSASAPASGGGGPR